MQHAYKTTDLAPEERMAVERSLGRAIQNDEAVKVVVHKIDEPQRGRETARRKGAAARILELSMGKGLGGTTVRELIGEGRRL
jgi:hypothetical protein